MALGDGTFGGFSVGGILQGVSGVNSYRLLLSGDIAGALSGGLLGGGGGLFGGSSDRNLPVGGLSTPSSISDLFNASPAGVRSSFRGAALVNVAESNDIKRIMVQLLVPQLKRVGLTDLADALRDEVLKVNNATSVQDAVQRNQNALVAIGNAKSFLDTVIAQPDFSFNGISSTQFRQTFDKQDTRFGGGGPPSAIGYDVLQIGAERTEADFLNDTNRIATAFNRHVVGEMRRLGFSNESVEQVIDQRRAIAANQAISPADAQIRNERFLRLTADLIEDLKGQTVIGGLLTSSMVRDTQVVFPDSGFEGVTTTSTPDGNGQVAQTPQEKLDNIFGADNQIDINSFDFQSQQFLDAEQAKADLITSQQQLQALQADDTATQEQIDEGQSDLNLNIAGFLTGALALGSLALGGIRESVDISGEDLNINLRSNIRPDFQLSPDLSIAGLLSRSQPSQQQSPQAGLLGQEPFKPIQPIIKKIDVPIKKVPVIQQGFPVQGAGLLAAA